MQTETGAVPIRVVLADDDPMVHRAFEVYLSRSSGIEVVGIAGDGEQAYDMVHALRPDVLVTDVHMPKLNGIELTRRVSGPPLNIKVVCFTAIGDDRLLTEAIQQGATGFLLKADSPALIIHGIRCAYSGDSMVSPKLVSSLLRRTVERDEAPPPDLSPSDRNLLALIGKGLTNAQIAEETGLATATVKTYVSRLLTRFDRPNRAALAALAYSWRLVE